MKQLIRESEVMVYAIGIDGQAEDDVRISADARAPPIRRRRCRFRFPEAGGRAGRAASILPQLPQFQWPFPQAQGRTTIRASATIA